MNSESENPALSIPQAPSCYDAALTDGDVLSKSTSGLQGAWFCSCKHCSRAAALQEFVTGQPNGVCNTEIKQEKKCLIP